MNGIGLKEHDSLLFARKNLDFLFYILEGYNFSIAGGSMARNVYQYIHHKDFSGMNGKEQDIDIFPIDEEESNKIFEKLMNEGAELINKNEYSNNIKLKYKRKNIDLISLPKFIGDATKVLTFFDMSQCGLMVSDKSCYYIENSFDCIEENKIILNFINTKNFYINRILKYINRGFKVTKKDFKFIESAKQKNGDICFNYTANYIANYSNLDGTPGLFPNGKPYIVHMNFDEECLENVRKI